MTSALRPHDADRIATEIASEVGLILRDRLMVAPARVEYADRDVLAAATDVCGAITRLDQARFSRDEKAARDRLENAARKLRTAIREARKRG